MTKTALLFFILFLNFSCAEKNQNDSLVKENSLLKTKVLELEKANTELRNQNSTLQSLQQENKAPQIPELKTSKLLKILDSRYSKDTLDLKEHGNEYVFERNVQLTKLDNRLFAETFGNITQQLSYFGYSVFSICDGTSLPLEMCNCTDSIYIVIAPENLGEDHELYRVGVFYDVNLISLKRIEKDNYLYDIELTFEHGVYPRKTEKINLTEMKLDK